MYPSSVLLSLLLASGSAVIAGGTRIGDEHYGNTEKGLFYLFGSNITIIDPESGDIVNELSGSSSWGDVVYMRDQAQLRHYAFANDRDPDKNDLVVIDCDEQEIISHVDVGFSPVHMYAIPSREEVWTHPDDNGTFDIIHMNDIEYLAHSHLIAHAWTPGHGKLLWDPNLQDRAFATNTNENKIYELDLDERELIYTINMTLDGLDDEYQCVRTHGIGYTWVNERLYVECSNPRTCKDYTDAANCSGSAWEVDVSVAPPEPTARLESPALNAKYEVDNMGVQGQIYVTPDERYAVVPNKNHNYLHFLKPVKNSDTRIVEVEVTGIPGKVAYYPKDGADIWGPDSSLADYYVIIAQEDDSDSSGLIIIDLEEIYDAFEADDGTPEVEVTYLELGRGERYRPVVRGSDYAVIPGKATSTDEGYTYVSVVDLETQELKFNLDIEGVKRVLWVPTHDDEKVADHEIRISALEDATDSETEIIAEAALAIAVVGSFAAILALLLAIKQGRQAKVASGGEYKPFICL